MQSLVRSETNRRVQCDHRSIDWSEVNTSQVLLAATRIRKEQGTDSLIEPLDGVGP